MKYVTLVFPEICDMVSFILEYQITNIETNSSFHTIKGMLSDEQIEIAERKYEARLYSNPIFRYQ